MDIEKSNSSAASLSPRKGGKDMTVSAESPSSPSYLHKQMSQKANCLCSPTTHAGSFRCRHHRGSIRRNSNSFTALAELSNKEACDNSN